MGLKPLEFSEALLDSPYFRENIHEHERELDRANDAIKSLIRECKSLIKATERKWDIRLLRFQLPFLIGWEIIAVDTLQKQLQFFAWCLMLHDMVSLPFFVCSHNFQQQVAATFCSCRRGSCYSSPILFVVM